MDCPDLQNKMPTLAINQDARWANTWERHVKEKTIKKAPTNRGSEKVWRK